MRRRNLAWEVCAHASYGRQHALHLRVRHTAIILGQRIMISGCMEALRGDLDCLPLVQGPSDVLLSLSQCRHCSGRLQPWSWWQCSRYRRGKGRVPFEKTPLVPMDGHRMSSYNTGEAMAHWCQLGGGVRHHDLAETKPTAWDAGWCAPCRSLR